jgi:hypothetical protein
MLTSELTDNILAFEQAKKSHLKEMKTICEQLYGKLEDLKRW